MKKVIFISFIFVFYISSMAAATGNIYLDGVGAFTQTNDAENEFGGGFSILYQLAPEFNFFVKNIFNTRKISDEGPSGKTYHDKYKYFMYIAGIEYLYNINYMPLYWKSNFGIGGGSADIKEGYNETLMSYTIDGNDTGLCLSLTTGLMYIFTQRLSGFFELGYHKTFFFDEFEEAKIHGIQVLLGVRITMWGVNRSIYSGY